MYNTSITHSFVKCCALLDFYINISFFAYICSTFKLISVLRGLRGRDRMVVGFTTTYAISAYHH